MIGLDTNVLLRFLLKDDQRQWEVAQQAILEIKAQGQTCYINQIVLCELTWVLKQSYKASREQITAVLEDLLKSDTFVVENSNVVRVAIQQFAQSKADFADCLIGKTNQRHVTKTITFDRKLKEFTEFAVLHL